MPQSNEPSVFVEEKHKLHSAESWLELWEVQLDATDCLRIVGNPDVVTLGGVDYMPAPIQRVEIKRDSQGVVQQVQVSILDVTGVVVGYLEAGQLVGKTVIYRLVNTADLTDESFSFSERFEILDAIATPAVVTFRLGQLNLFEQPFPKNRFTRTRCRHLYGSDDCAYDTTRSGAIADCDLTLHGANGCIVHGDDEVSAGKPRRHPLQFGGQPSLLKGPYA
jgi:phage-related protein